MKGKSRMIWLDLCENICDYVCCATHTSERVYDLHAENLLQNTWFSRVFAISMFTIGRLGVPILFLILDICYWTKNMIEQSTETFL